VSRYPIVLADDHRLVRECIKKILLDVPDLEVIAEAADGEILLRLLRGNHIHPEMVIMDISMPNLEGIEATRIIKEEFPALKVLILTVQKERAYLNRALAAGAEGFLLKEEADSELTGAVEMIRKGGLFISPQFTSR
jgi:two-component system, NarL family, response regulator NreC